MRPRWRGPFWPMPTNGPATTALRPWNARLLWLRSSRSEPKAAEADLRPLLAGDAATRAATNTPDSGEQTAAAEAAVFTLDGDMRTVTFAGSNDELSRPQGLPLPGPTVGRAGPRVPCARPGGGRAGNPADRTVPGGRQGRARRYRPVGACRHSTSEAARPTGAGWQRWRRTSTDAVAATTPHAQIGRARPGLPGRGTRRCRRPRRPDADRGQRHRAGPHRGDPHPALRDQPSSTSTTRHSRPTWTTRLSTGAYCTYRPDPVSPVAWSV